MGLESGMEDDCARDGGDLLTSSEDEDAAEVGRATERPPGGAGSPDAVAAARFGSCPSPADRRRDGERPAGLEPGPAPGDLPDSESGPPPAAQPTPGSQHVYCTVYCVESENGENSALGGEGEQTGYPPDSGRRTDRDTALSPPPEGPSISEPFNISRQIDINSLGNLYVGEYKQLVILTCRVCLDDKPIRPLPCCKKAVCEECLKRYLSNQVQLGRAEIKCPITECSKYMDESTVISNLPRDDIVKYSYFLELSRVDSSTKPCPQCKHFTTYRRKSNIPTPTKSESKFKIQCSVCQFVWCFKCHSPWHEGLNCKEYRKGDKLLRHWASEIEHGQRNAQKCPKCKIHIQRTEGCDHMNCSQCNTNFCYRCGETYRHFRFFGDHTSNLSIFGCKYRYLPDRPHLRRLVRGSVCGNHNAKKPNKTHGEKDRQTPSVQKIKTNLAKDKDKQITFRTEVHESESTATKPVVTAAENLKFGHSWKAGKLLIAPLMLLLVVVVGAIAFVVGLFVFPIYYICKKQRKRSQTGMFT